MTYKNPNQFIKIPEILKIKEEKVQKKTEDDFLVKNSEILDTKGSTELIDLSNEKSSLKINKTISLI